MKAAPPIWAIVPVKSLTAAKVRLAPLLEATERQLLARVMLEDVLDACIGAPSLAGILVVTADPEVECIADRAGARVLLERHERGTNAAIRSAIRALSGGTSGVIVVPSDLPHLRAEDLDALARLCSPRVLVLVPAKRDGGTNLLACAPPDLIETRYGPGSFQQHLNEGARIGIETRLPPLGRLDLDLDCPDDIRAFLDLSTTTRTRRVLIDLDVPARLATGAVMRSKDMAHVVLREAT